MPEIVEIVEDEATLKERGNQYFKEGDWENALSCYTDALHISKEDSLDRAVYYKNRAAVYIKLCKYEKAVKDCDKAIEISPNDAKAYYRRSQAYEHLENFESAYKDARKVHNIEPKNSAIQAVLARLQPIVQNKVAEADKISSKVSKMFELTFDRSSDLDSRQKALNNLLVLVRERAGAEVAEKAGLVQKLVDLSKVEKDLEVELSIVRILSEFCRNNVDHTKTTLKSAGIQWFIDQLSSNNDIKVNATQYSIQTMLNTLAGMDTKNNKKPDKNLLEANKTELETILTVLMCSSTLRTLTGLARDAIIELLMRNISWEYIDFGSKFVDNGGVGRLCEIASELKEYPYESCMNITDSTRSTVSVCLHKLYEQMYYDKAKANYTEKVEEFIKDKLLGPDIESKVRVTATITTLLLGPLDVGNQFIAKEGILEMMLVMAGTDDILQQKVAAEALIAAASKKDKVKTLVTSGTDILKKLYSSKDDGIRVRALVGLCKLSSMGGTDATVKPFADGAGLKLAEACRRFLINPSKDMSMRKWAVEGLSYLTLDAEVKEKLIEDKTSLRAMIELGKTGGQDALYGVVTTLVNLTNSYDKQEIIPEMIELAKFAKQHIPEEHELDDKDFVDKRIIILGKEGVTTALVALSKTESANSRELIARVFNAVCEQQELRGLVVQQGGAKTLLTLALDGTDKGKVQAAQALSRLAITIDPAVAFPGQRSQEVVRPLVALLHPNCTGLQNFEALMGLCNLASMGNAQRRRILDEKAFMQIQNYMFEDHDLIRRAATQCMINLIPLPEVIQRFEGKNDLCKLLLILCSHEDRETQLAAAGGLAMLTAESKNCCEKVFEALDWLDILRCLVTTLDLDLLYRGLTIVFNMVCSSKETAEKLLEEETRIVEVLNAVTRIEMADNEKHRKLAGLILQQGKEWKVVKKETDMDDIE